MLDNYQGEKVNVSFIYEVTINKQNRLKSFKRVARWSNTFCCYIVKFNNKLYKTSELRGENNNTAITEF